MIGELALVVGTVKSLYDIGEARRRRRAGASASDIAMASDGRALALEQSDDGILRLAHGNAIVDDIAAWGLLHGEFVPADDLAADYFGEHEEALVVVWDVRDDPELDSVAFWSSLGGSYWVELPAGIYSAATLVFDGESDVVVGAAMLEGFELLPYEDLLLTLAVEVTDPELSHLLLEESAPNAGLLVVDGGPSIALLADTTIGRAPGCELVLGGWSVSRRHATIQHTPDGYILTDLHSASGTFLNGERVDSAMLADGDMIHVGGRRLDVRLS